jgi:hypothetical protein
MSRSKQYQSDVGRQVTKLNLSVHQGYDRLRFGVSEGNIQLYKAELSYSEAVMIVRAIEALMRGGLRREHNDIIDILKMVGWDEANHCIPVISPELLDHLIQLLDPEDLSYSID